jgi:hypothetical protein
MIFGNGNHLKSCVKHIFNPSQGMGTHLNFWLYFQSSFRLGTPARNRRWQHQHVVLARHLRGGEFFGSWQDDPVPKFDDFLKSFSINTGYILRYPIFRFFRETEICTYRDLGEVFGKWRFSSLGKSSNCGGFSSRAADRNDRCTFCAGPIPSRMLFQARARVGHFQEASSLRCTRF